jgi:GDP-L-fucose synthase
MDIHSRIYVAGHRGLVGSSIIRQLTAAGADHLLTRTHKELDLTDESQVREFFDKEKPEYVFLAAAKVGGIHANNTFPAEFIRENLAIQTNVIHHAWKSGVRKLVFLGSSCIYPRECPQPIKEEYLLTGPLEPTNEAYAIAKIAGLKMWQSYRRQYGFDAVSAMPTNLYGPGDNYHPTHSHVVPALIRRIHQAKLLNAAEVVIWGTGEPLREFLHADDLASALLFLMNNYDDTQIVNIGSGNEVSIAKLAELICNVVGFEGRLSFDTSKPDGTPRKLLDTHKLDILGWHARINLIDGLKDAYREFIDHWASHSE